MPKAPIAPITTALITPHGADEDQKIEVLTRKDRESLNSFVKHLNREVRLDDMDEALKAWWMSRY